tara:strand:+ start:136 stop:672 length:537 start_codon:yes stop_codon:yes gene_type:complete
MIIACDNCNKQFNVSSDLIPSNGRLLQCSSCNHKWFFKKVDPPAFSKPANVQINKNNNDISISTIKNDKKTGELPIFDIKTDEKKDELATSEIKININSDELPTSVIKNKINSNEKSSNNKLSLLNIILIFIISFTAFIVLVDTFKSPLGNIIPNLEIILYNLYESFKDIILFIKDLI